MDPLKALKDNPFALAPMAAITDCPFRTVMRALGCGPVITELVSAHGLEFNSAKTRRLMNYEPSQRPIGIQLFGETPEILARGAAISEEAGADFVDLNFGCPVPKVVKKGAGSAILRDLPRVEATFRAVRAAIQIPLTVKIRTGWDDSNRTAVEVAQIAYDEGLSWVAIHGRTRAAAYTGLADWDYIAEVKSRSKIAIIGNGDIVTAEQAVARLNESGVDGVMIGRGCLKNPWIFKEAQALWRREMARRPHGQSAAQALSPVPDSGAEPGFRGGAGSLSSAAAAIGDRDFESLFELMRTAYESETRSARAITSSLATSRDEASDEAFDLKIVQIQLRKFASWYSAGYPGASVFRKAIFQTQSIDETMELALGFFRGLRSVLQADTSQEAFLMGGHG